MTTQYDKAALISILKTNADKATADADKIVAQHIKDTNAAAERSANDISQLDDYFKQVIRELRRGVTKEATRRIVDGFKTGSAKLLAEKIIKDLKPAMPTEVAPLRAKANAIHDVIRVVEAVSGDSISLTDAGRLGVLGFLPILKPTVTGTRRTVT